MTRPPRPEDPRIAIVIVGIHGHGASHVAAARALAATGGVRLAGLVDRTLTDEDRLAGDAPLFTSLDECLAAVSADVVVLSTPIHTHRALAITALEHGADLLLEKPPVTSSAELHELLAVARRTGGLVQVGFQSLGSHAIGLIHELVAAGTIGEVRSFDATGTWVRTTGYWTRAAWSGRRQLDGVPVVDGVVTNPLAHAVQTMLRLADATREDDLARIELDQYRANDIEADDTSAVRLTLARGTVLTAALTLCAAQDTDPIVTVRGTAGEIRFAYTKDRVEVDVLGEETRVLHVERTGLLENLLAARATIDSDDPVPLVSTLEDAGAFTALLDAIRAAPAPRPIGAEHVDWIGSGADRRPVLRGVEELVHRAASSSSTFAELGAPWAGVGSSESAAGMLDG